MAYAPRNVPTDPAQLPDFLRAELQRLAQELSATNDLLRIAEINVTPDKPRIGDIRLQDGTNWTDVAGGQQPVWFDGTAWQPFGGGTGANLYDCGGFYPGIVVAATIMMRHVFVRTVSFASNFADSKGSATASATAQTDFDIRKDGSSVGTMRFAAGATTPTFITSGAVQFVSPNVMSVHAPNPMDATLANVAWMLKGTPG